MSCLFCKIIAGEIPAKLIYEDEFCVAFNDINPQAPTHFLVIPREHFASLNEMDEKHEAAMGHILRVCAKAAQATGIAESGFRTVINTGADAGQSVFHLHVHVLGGRIFGWGPG